MITEPAIRRLMLSRYFLQLADQNAKSQSELAVFAAINLVQDSVEFFLLAAADSLNVPVTSKTVFERYIELIDAKLAELAARKGVGAPTLPYRSRLIIMNKQRVAAKHDGVKPNPEEVRRSLSDARAFLEEGAKLVFEVDFWTINLLELLEDGEVKQCLEAAVASHQNGAFFACLAECKKAIYLELVYRYDVQAFKDTDESDFFAGFFSRAPYYARNKKYVSDNVSNPFEYIVLNHDDLESQLARNGIDHGTFWNVWRLTPDVYRHQGSDPWQIKDDFHLSGGTIAKENAAYVLETTIDIMLSISLTKRRVKSTGYQEYFIKLKRENVAVYAKADKGSRVVDITPDGLRALTSQFSCPGLNDNERYIRVSHHTGPVLDAATKYISGYILDEDVDW